MSERSTPAHERRGTTIALTRIEDAAVVRAVVVRFAQRWGFDDRSAKEVAIGASELATNAVKHGGGGELSVSLEDDAIVLCARDRGPGPPPIEELLTDGVSHGAKRLPETPIRSGLGCGGGALARLFDEVELGPRDGGGASVRCVRRRRS